MLILMQILNKTLNQLLSINFKNKKCIVNWLFPFLCSFHCRVQNATIPCRSQEHPPLLSVKYNFLPPFSTNYSSILSRLILPSISWSTSESCCSKIHTQYPFGNSNFFHFLYMTNVIYLTLLSLL